MTVENNIEFHHMLTDIADLKSNVHSIKSEITEMRKTVSSAMEKMTDAVVALAVLTEKLNNNIEDHKILHLRIDEVKSDLDKHITTEFSNLKISHTNLKASHAALALAHSECKAEKNNSFFNKLKDRVMEMSVVVLFILLFVLLIKNGPIILALFTNIK